MPGSHAYTAFISPFGTFQYIRMPFGLENAGSMYSRMLDVAMKNVDRDFWTSYLDDIMTFSGEPWSNFGHLVQVVQAHAAKRDQDKTLQDKVVPVRGGVLRAQDQQGWSFDDPRVRTADQGLART